MCDILLSAPEPGAQSGTTQHCPQALQLKAMIFIHSTLKSPAYRGTSGAFDASAAVRSQVDHLP